MNILNCLLISIFIIVIFHIFTNKRNIGFFSKKPKINFFETEAPFDESDTPSASEITTEGNPEILNLGVSEKIATEI